VHYLHALCNFHNFDLRFLHKVSRIVHPHGAPGGAPKGLTSPSNDNNTFAWSGPRGVVGFTVASRSADQVNVLSLLPVVRSLHGAPPIGLLIKALEAITSSSNRFAGGLVKSL
jgi:hypothetical protein